MGVESFVIVGAGIFGASTALHLVELMPGVPITLIDKAPFPNQASASVDINKIIRTDYADAFYLRLAVQAEILWKTNKLYSQFYHPADHVYMENDGESAQILKHYADLGIQNGAEMITVHALKERYPNLFTDTDYQGLDRVFLNPSSGWAEATSALAAVVERAVGKGVTYLQADIDKLSFNEYGNCNGVYTREGERIFARNTILAAGPGTVELLANSSHKGLEFKVEDRILSAAVVSGNIKVKESQAPRFQHVPIFVHDVGDVDGEVLPLTKNQILKIASETSFKNTVYHAPSGMNISIPPKLPDSGQWVVPQDLKDECRKICSDIFGTLGDELDFESYRISWDCISADGDFIISGHSESRGLYFASGGSFHSWKFLPIIGEFVYKAILNTLEPEFKNRWAWERDMVKGPQGGLWPDREWKDFQ